VSPANAAKPSPNAQNFSALPLPSKASGYVRHMAGEAPALKPRQADNVVQQQKSFMVTRPLQNAMSVVKPVPD